MKKIKIFIENRILYGKQLNELWRSIAGGLLLGFESATGYAAHVFNIGNELEMGAGALNGSLVGDMKVHTDYFLRVFSDLGAEEGHINWSDLLVLGGLPQLYIKGFVPSNDVSDPDNSLSWTTGVARDDTDGYDIRLTSPLSKSLSEGFVLGSGGGMAVFNGDLLQEYILAMTSNSTPAGWIASATQEANPAYQAFDKVSSSAWNSTNTILPQVLQIQQPYDTRFNSYSLQAPNTVANMLSGWTFEGSTDGLTWDVLDTISGESGWTAGEIRNFSFVDSGTAYSYFRINITANNGGAIFAVEQMQLTGYILGTFTSISDQVVGVNTLFSMHSIGDSIWSHSNQEYQKILSIADDTHLTLETPFTSDVATPEDFKWSGARPNTTYHCFALYDQAGGLVDLGYDTNINAINLLSTPFVADNNLNQKRWVYPIRMTAESTGLVSTNPPMISNTTPAPYIVSTNAPDTQVYKAFDVNISTRWDISPIGSYAQIDTVDQKVGVAWYYRFLTKGTNARLTLYGSTDASSWTQLSTINWAGAGHLKEAILNFVNVTPYRYYRFVLESTGYAVTTLFIDELRVYKESLIPKVPKIIVDGEFAEIETIYKTPILAHTADFGVSARSIIPLPLPSGVRQKAFLTIGGSQDRFLKATDLEQVDLPTSLEMCDVYKGAGRVDVMTNEATQIGVRSDSTNGDHRVICHGNKIRR